MSSGDGNVFEDALNGVTQVATLGQAKYTGNGFKAKDNTLDLLTQISTGGLVGYGDGKLKAGKQTKAVQKIATDPIKEITGAKAAEEANALARDQFEQSTADTLAARQNNILKNQQNQIAASQGATAAVGKKATTNKTVTPLGGTTDFLGL